ncbi:MAG: nucleotidyltransferase family protein, partial [Sphingobium sp.]
DAYYRRWMHELPPMIHRTRDRMIDVHRTILPLTAKVAPDASALIADAVELSDGVAILSPEDRVCHAVAHLLADGDLSGGLRNLWDIRCLMNDVDNISDLEKRAALHGLSNQLSRARRLVCALFGEKTRLPPRIADRIFAVRLLSRDGWGRDSRKWLGFAFYIRSHFLRMPPLMLARHLWTKWSRGYRPG